MIRNIVKWSGILSDGWAFCRIVRLIAWSDFFAISICLSFLGRQRNKAPHRATPSTITSLYYVISCYYNVISYLSRHLYPEQPTSRTPRLTPGSQGPRAPLHGTHVHRRRRPRNLPAVPEPEVVPGPAPRLAHHAVHGAQGSCSRPGCDVRRVARRRCGAGEEILSDYDGVLL